MTFKNDKRVMEKAIEMHHEYLEVLKDAGIKGNWTLQDMFQPIPTFFGEIGVKKGGNVLGLDRFDDNLQRESYRIILPIASTESPSSLANLSRLGRPGARRPNARLRRKVHR